MKGKLQRNMNCNGISIIINGIPSERRVPASCSYIEIEDIWKYANDIENPAQRASHRLTLDLWLVKDNRFLNPKSSYGRIPAAVTKDLTSS
jgi:hypothetical protein